MTDPWCCYIWCAMDPINIPPNVSINIAAPWIRHGFGYISSVPSKQGRCTADPPACFATVMLHGYNQSTKLLWLRESAFT